MKRWEHFDYDEHEGVATLTFSRPERLNALTFDVYADIRDLTDSLRRRQDIRVLVIRGRVADSALAGTSTRSSPS